MAAPTPYNRSYSFSDFQANNPSQPLPGPQVDNELENIEQSLDGAIDAINDVRRADGALPNEKVTLDSLAPEVREQIGEGATAARDAAIQASQDSADSAAASASSAGAAAGSAGSAATSAGQAATARNAAQNARDDAIVMKNGADTARDFAAQWASAPENVLVNDGLNPAGFSAHHWAVTAEGAMTGTQYRLASFGAIADGDGEGGGTDNSAAITAAWGYSIANNVLIQVPYGQTFRCDTPLAYAGAGTFGFTGGGALDFTNCTTPKLITVTGPAWTNPQALTVFSAYPSRSLKVVNAAGYAADNVIRISSNKIWADSTPTTHSEFRVIDSVDYGTNTITLTESVRGVYNTGDAAKIELVDMSCRPHFDIDIIAQKGSAVATYGIEVNRAAHGFFRGTFFNCYDRSLYIRNSIFCRGGGLTFISSDLEGQGYGLVDGGNQWCQWGDLTGHECRHVYTGGRSTELQLGRENTVGNVIGHGCRDSIVDQHQGATDTAFGHIEGSMKVGNLSDYAVTLQSDRITILSINITGIEQKGLYWSFFGGDPSAQHFLRIGSCVLQPGPTATRDWAFAISNLCGAMKDGSGSLPQAIDDVSVGLLNCESKRGMTFEATGGDIKRVSIGGGRVVGTEFHAAYCVTSALGRVGLVATGLEIECQSADIAHYAVYANGALNKAATGIFGADVDLFGCQIKGGAQNHVRSNDAHVEIHGGRSTFSGVGVKYLKSGIGVIKTPTLTDAT